jgi:hypothetical protein
MAYAITIGKFKGEGCVECSMVSLQTPETWENMFCYLEMEPPTLDHLPPDYGVDHIAKGSLDSEVRNTGQILYLTENKDGARVVINDMSIYAVLGLRKKRKKMRKKDRHKFHGRPLRPTDIFRVNIGRERRCRSIRWFYL